MGGAFENFLIEAVRKQPVLYDRNAVGYNCKEDVDGAWNEVTEEVSENVKNINVTHCKLRWRTLRDRFVKQIAKTPDGEEHMLPEAKKWEYTNQLSFLRRHLHKRKCEEIIPKRERKPQRSYKRNSNSSPAVINRQRLFSFVETKSIPRVNTPEDSFRSISGGEEYHDESDFEHEIEIPSPTLKRQKIEEVEFPIESFEIEQLDTEEPTQQTPQLRVSINEASLNNLLNTTNELLQQQITQNQRKSPNEAYLRVLDEYFQKLSPNELDKVKVEILNLILMKKRSSAKKVE